MNLVIKPKSCLCLKLSKLLISLYFLMNVAPISFVMAMATQHPIDLFEKGEEILLLYRGNPARLIQARKIFNDLIERFPNSSFGYLGLSKLSRINAFKHEGHYNMGIIREQGLPMAIKALEFGPSIRAVHENFGIYERIFEQHTLNQKYARKHLLLAPESAETYFVVANFMWDQEKITKALEYFNEALALFPDDLLRFKILKRIAYIHLKEYEQPEKSLDYYKQALDIFTDCPITHEYIGKAYLAMEEEVLARKYLNHSLKLHDNDGTRYYLFLTDANLFEKKGDIKNAIACLLEAVGIRTENSALHYQIGNLYYNINDYDKAYEHFNLVISLTPTDAHAYFYAGRSADSLGDKGLAVNYYKKCIQLNSESSESKWIREHVPEVTYK